MPPRGKGIVVDKVLDSAIRTGNIQGAIDRFGKGLTVAEVNVILSLTSSELKQLAQLRRKLVPLGEARADNNGGIF